MKKLTPTGLYKMISAKGTSWSDIRDNVIKTNGVPANWLTQVRGPLQYLLNTGKIGRVADPTKEVYYRLT